MGKAKPPAGADLLFSELVRCEMRDGVVVIEVRSGAYIERGMIPLRLAMELHDKLSGIFSRVARVKCVGCPSRER